jgi:tRNA-Thr(GGU) m(6)t(6)A37 methyltransferase TsaA
MADATAYKFTPIGHLRSIFKTKNGTVRQSGLSRYARATLTIPRSVFNNPAHALENLADYSHVWLIWIFHANTSAAVKAKVSPPRLNGARVGVFSTRSPHRPCPIGLTLARLEGVEGDTLVLSGVDIIDGTPVLDIKPYIPLYDSPAGSEGEGTVDSLLDSNGDVCEGERSLFSLLLCRWNLWIATCSCTCSIYSVLSFSRLNENHCGL